MNNSSSSTHLFDLSSPIRRPARSTFKRILIFFYHCIAVISIYLVGSSIILSRNSADRALEAINKIKPGIAISRVKPRGSLIEITAQDRTVYATTDGKWFLYGQLFNGGTGEPVLDSSGAPATPAKQEVSQAKQQIPIADLTAVSSYAIQGGTKGAPKLFILSDPDCPYCKRLDGELKKLSGIETNTLLFPIEELHPGATEKAGNILCSKDRSKALDAAFHGEVIAHPAEAVSCKPMLDDVSAFAERNGFTGTPILITEDGRVHQGFINAPQIKQWLGL